MKFQELLLASLFQNPSKVAIKDEVRSLNYRELLEESDKITKLLLDSNIARESHVGIMLENPIDIIISTIGVLNAGCVFVPIDQKMPKSRLKGILDQLDLSTMITTKFSIADVKTDTTLFLEDLRDKEHHKIEYPEYREDDSIYVYFTSGTTGVPKGIVGKNKSLAQFINWEIKEFGLDETVMSSQLISPYFDAFLRDVFVPLIAGGTIQIPPHEEDFLTPEKLIPWLETNEISLIHCVPSIFRILNQPDKLNSSLYGQLKHVLLSGEKIIPNELNSWYKIFEDRIQLVNLYGTTEATMIRSIYRIEPEDVRRAKMPIGVPIDDTQLLVMSGKEELVEAGLLIPGDLYIQSDFLTKGYLNDESSPSERFVEINGKTAFKTGDKARKLQDGNLELLGREDRQVKILGVRIELDEIEHTLSRCEGVDEIVVILKESNEQTDVVYAFFKSTRPIEEVDPKLQAFADEYLPVYMRPSRFVGLDQFPLLTTGKVDLKKLLEISDKQSKELIEPSNEIEERLLEIWIELLGGAEISVDDNFLKVGGNSLSLMRLTTKIYGAFSVRIPLGDLFKNLTIQKQATFISQLGTSGEGFQISKAPEKSQYQVTTSQERMFIQQSLDKSNTTYNLPYVVKIDGKPDFSRLENAFTGVIEKHESLRTIFQTDGDGLFQTIQDAYDFKLVEVQTSDLNEAIKNFIQPFDLSTGPVIRAAVIKLDQGACYLIMDVHHIVCDGISQGLFFLDFIQLYNSQTLEPLKLQYKDFAEWERSFLETDAYHSQREFWLNSFENEVPRLDLPKVELGSSGSEATGSNVRFSLLKSQVSPMMDHLQDKNCTSFSVLYSYFMIYLMQLTGKDDFVVGIASSGRVHEEVEGVIGMFVKTLPIRIKVDVHKSIGDLIKEVNDHLLNALARQLYDLSDVIKELNKQQLGRGDELFEVMFTYQNYQSEEIRELGKNFEPYYFEKTENKFPINWIVEESENTFEINFEYSRLHFKDEDIPALTGMFEKLVENSTRYLDQSIYDLITEAEPVGDLTDDIQFNF